MTARTAAAEERRLGLDRRTIAPALLVLALAVLMSLVLPSIDSHTSYRDEIRTGDVAALADGITLVPAPGWQLATGALVGQTRSPIGSTATTELVDAGVSLSVQVAPFDGTPSALLTRINQIGTDLLRARGRTAATTHRYAVTTRQGAVGVGEDVVGVGRQGLVVAFVFRSPGPSSQGRPAREGLQVVVSGPSGQVARRRDDIVAMIRSIRTGS